MPTRWALTLRAPHPPWVDLACPPPRFPALRQGSDGSVRPLIRWQYNPGHLSDPGLDSGRPPSALCTRMQVRASPCSFLHANATVRRDVHGSLYGSVKIRFGSSWTWPGGAEARDDEVGSAEPATADGDPPSAWPSLAGVRILGWEGGAPDAVRARSYSSSDEASGSQGQGFVDLTPAEVREAMHPGIGRGPVWGGCAHGVRMY